MTVDGEGYRPGERSQPDASRTREGLALATYDFGGQGRDLLLVHATGFCAEVLRPFARALADSFHCWAVDLRGHGRSDRPPNGDFAWARFGDDVLAAVDRLGLVDPVGFGHSCGGAALLLAEESVPGTFASLYCFEPIVFPEPRRGFPAENPLSEGARRRRETFPSAEDAFVNFVAKPPFCDLDPEVLRAYVEAGFELVADDDGGDGRTVRLRCRRDDEAAIYDEGLRHHAFANLGSVGCPVALACGEKTDAVGPVLLEYDAARLPHATIEVIPHLGHFGPLEDPPAVARSLLRSTVTDRVPPRP